MNRVACADEGPGAAAEPEIDQRERKTPVCEQCRRRAATDGYQCTRDHEVETVHAQGRDMHDRPKTPETLLGALPCERLCPGPAAFDADGPLSLNPRGTTEPAGWH